MKNSKYVYYAFNGLLTALLGTAGVAKLMMAAADFAQKSAASGITNIGTMKFIGLCEVLGAVGIWVGRGKSWAYHGCFFLFCGAFATHLGVNDEPKNMLGSIIGLCLTSGAYYFWMKSGICKEDCKTYKLAA